jgi:hypothetical protein
MEYEVNIAGVAADLGAINDMLVAADPAAVVDLDPFSPVLRVSAAVTTGELLGLLHETGCEVPPNAVRPRPSVCCGGCGG